MKKILVLLPLLTLLGLARLNAQVSVNVNIGTPPAWGPYGYADARFYFIPDIDVYYDVWYGNYWYYDYNQWTCMPSLPPRYRNYDLYGCYKVVLDYRGNNPYRYYDNHRHQYASYRHYNGPRQYTYRDRGGYGHGHHPVQGRANNYGNRNDHNRGDNDIGYNRGDGRSENRSQPQARPTYQNRGNGNNQSTMRRGDQQNGNGGNNKVGERRGGGGQQKGGGSPRQGAPGQQGRGSGRGQR